MPVGNSGCMYMCAFSGGSPPLVHALGSWVGGEECGFKRLREVGSLLGYLTAEEKTFYCMRVILQSCCDTLNAQDVVCSQLARIHHRNHGFISTYPTNEDPRC